MVGQIATLGAVAKSSGRVRRPWLAQAGLMGVAALAFSGVMLGGDAAETARAVAADVDLALLFRAMAGLKAVMAAVALGVVMWRLGSPIGSGRLVLYAVATAAMAVGPALIWNLVHVGWGASLLQGGFLAAVLLLWRDPVVGERLQAIIDARRNVLRRRGASHNRE